MHKVLGVAAKRLAPLQGDERGPELDDAREEVAELVERRGWRAEAHGPAGECLAGVIVALRRAGHGGFVELLDDYAAAAEPVARADLDYVGRRVAREDMVESVVVGTMLGEAMFSALRRLAHVDASSRAYRDGGGDDGVGAGRGVVGGGPGGGGSGPGRGGGRRAGSGPVGREAGPGGARRGRPGSGPAGSTARPVRVAVIGGGAGRR
ncbi:MerR family transcriptional regulator [Streptomyces sp. NPDC088252]|uniref:MerR family transcriptional regulator n=1 Tax=Streptomyces sp. NPDC088252 TaxID=3365845 RepID=UPI003818B7EC